MTPTTNPHLPNSPDWQWWLGSAITITILALVVATVIWFVWLRARDRDDDQEVTTSV
jgi:hypothetical protein